MGQNCAGVAMRDGRPPATPRRVWQEPGTEYERYTQTDALLACQRPESSLAHRDELLFVRVHQVHELLLMQVDRELGTAAERIGSGDLAGARDLVGRAAHMIRLLTASLDLLQYLSTEAFAAIRPNLGTGSGAQSPGWRALRCAVLSVDRAFTAAAAHRTDPAVEMVADALRELDEQVGAWRRQHHHVAERLLGADAVGTAGMPVPALTRLAGQRLFPRLWQTRLTAAAAPGGDQ
jgi:tryptophan 2,3-dioxygenase